VRDSLRQLRHLAEKEERSEIKNSSEHVTALFELQNTYSNNEAKAHKTKVRRRHRRSSMRGVL
jgi:hypothetical protein